MSSELLGAAQNVLKGNLGGAWDINKGYADAYTDLGVARRFGGSAATYSLRDIGAMNGRVVNVRREPEDTTAAIDDEAEFSANQVQSGALEDWVNGKLESTLPADVATAAAAYSLRKVKSDYTGNAVRIRRDDTDGEADVAFDSEGNVSNNSLVTVITGSGDTGSTLYDYLRANDPDGADAYVDTWYDQAGSNNAVQATAANQPKIAENGALLADGLDFDGSNDFLESTTLSSIYTGTDTVSSAFVVVNSDVATTTQYIIAAGNTGLSNPMYNTLFHSGGNLGWQARDTSGTLKSNLSATPYVADQMYLVSNINSGTTTDFNSNAVVIDDGADSDVGDKTINTVKLGARGNASSSPLNGSIKEAIFYASDQSANRFKIESNINNYYGLYNDANEFSTSTWQNGGTGSNDSWDSLTNSSTDGFVASTDNGSGSTENAVCSLNFANVVPDNGRVFVSFNLEFGGTAVSLDSKKVRVQLRDSSGNIANDIVQPADGGDGGTQFRICNQGFNRVAYTVNSSTASNLEFLLEVGNGRTGNMTVTDLKISRIARNGFVETWYDQSSNGNDVDQGTAGSQPAIVQNGGQVKVGNRASIKFDGTDDFLERATYTQGAIAQINTIFSVAKLDTFADENRKIYDSHSSTARNMLFLSTNGNGEFGHYAGTVQTTGQDADANQHLFTSRLNGEASRLYIDGVQKSTANTGTFSMQGITVGANHDQSTNNCWKGDIQEIIVYNSDQNNDRANQQDDINNYYTIY